jgi:hypothetical protein
MLAMMVVVATTVMRTVHRLGLHEPINNEIN